MIDMYRDQFGVKPICDVLEVPLSMYYQIKRRERDPCQRTKRDRIVLEEIRRVHREDYGVYGARKIWKQLGREGIPVARCTIERLMKQAGITGAVRGKRYRTTTRDSLLVKPTDLVNRRFLSDTPNRLWVGDFTYVHTRSGVCYTAFVIDAFSRSIPGFSVSNTWIATL